MKPNFYQMVPMARRHDAVGRMAWALHFLFASSGKRSLVFTEKQKSPRLGLWSLGPLRDGLLRGAPAWDGKAPPEVAFYHHSIGTAVAERFLAWPARRKVLLYHNITPDHLEGLAPSAVRAQQLGREQLPALIRASNLQIGLSEYSCGELRERGAPRVLKLPYLLWQRDLPPGPRERPGPRILVVGRVVPHKGIREAVLAFMELRKHYGGATLTILGNLRGSPEYVGEIRALIQRAGLDRVVRLRGRVSERALRAYYQSASALLSLSEHEGFCVPLVEAMRARTPIVALSSSAVPETLGSGGVLVAGRDPVTVAEALHRLFSEERLREELRAAQEREVSRFSVESFSRPLWDALGALP